MAWRTIVLAWGATVSVGCGPSLIDGERGDTGGTDTGAGSSTTAMDEGPGTSPGTNGTTSPGTTPDPTVGTTPDDTESESDPTTSDDDPGCSFLGCNLDIGEWFFDCDLWAQDCPVGEKCMPWANDGGHMWNATKCAPVARDADAPGDPCIVEGSGVTGLDSCELGSMCWDVDPETLEGTCVAFCTGSPDAPGCADPANACIVQNDSVLVLCLPVCDPLAQDCAVGAGCYFAGDAFVCMPDHSEGTGIAGAACQLVNGCAPGLFCASPDDVPECGDVGCCSEFCDLLAPDPDLQCAGQAQGQACLPWFEDGEAPEGFDDVGACLVPN